MFLEYLALILTIVGLVLVFYKFIYILELPYEAAKHRNHPHLDAIYVACWLSLFTLHAIWPLVYIWALTHKGPSSGSTETADQVSAYSRLTELERRLERLEKAASLSKNCDVS